MSRLASGNQYHGREAACGGVGAATVFVNLFLLVVIASYHQLLTTVVSSVWNFNGSSSAAE
jgi:hypothetical protein